MAESTPKIDMERDYYAELELSETANVKEIKSRRRTLALKFHPDKTQGNQEAVEKFRIIQQAYEILSDPEKKATYDEQRSKLAPPGYPTPRQPNQARAGTTQWRAQGERFSHYTKSKARANNGAQSYMGNDARAAATEGKGHGPPPPRTASARGRAEASFGSRRRRNASHFRNEPPATSSPPHQPPEFPFRQPAHTTSSHHPFEPPKQPQQPAGAKQSSSTIPTPSASQDTNDKRQSDNTPNADKKRPGKPEAGSGDTREFHKLFALEFPTPPTDTRNFEKYLEEWNLFEIEIIGHYVARQKDIAELQRSRSDIKKYYEWLRQDRDLRGRFIEAGEEHEKQFRNSLK
ncbi:hypothetical protein FMUND_11048 [Fusarium mundagurra]|uniref:J domain-containing protein n=1 Tax=Fusarium mundagurra TaxID=1567541 RepID=A0A8H5YAA2_9HYPO|nr:hypothetical protein FMUND_11048 [Fusarium mundagurra]